MQVVVVGASGNVGTSVVSALQDDGRVDRIVAIARRPPDHPGPGVEWRSADVTRDDLVPHFRGSDAVVHLAWAIQPSHDEDALRRINVEGSVRVFDAAAEAGASTLVYASSVGAYSPAPKDTAVDESWPTHGVATSSYSRHKAYVERVLDAFELVHPGLRVVRLRPGLIFKGEAASEIRRFFAGPLLPGALVRPSLIPVVPDTPGLRFQAVHAADVGQAFRLAVTSDARGAFNIAAEPVLDPPALARILGARRLPVPAGVLRAGAALSWHLRLQPTAPGWVDLALQAPILDTTRARTVLGWTPARGADDALSELLSGMQDQAGASTPRLSTKAGGRGRVQEVLTAVGGRET